jgi:hypothetical protein
LLLTCEICLRDGLQQQHKCCRRCGSRNPSYVKPDVLIIAEPTELELKIARRLFAEGIDFILGPEIWYSSCTYYTPDFLIEDRFVVEIDGQHHYTDSHQVLMDRIRQRAIENSGYPVYRFTNEEVRKSLDKTINKILLLLSSSKGTTNQSSIIEVDVSKEHNLSSVMENILKDKANELYKRTLVEGWTVSVFNDVLSEFISGPNSNRCAMQRIMLSLLGLNFKASGDGTADFHNYATLFEKAIFILQEFFGDIATVELKNEFNISATTFLKNLVYYGKPGIAPNRIVYIKNYDDIQNLVKNFNSNFSTLDIQVSENDLKIECLHERKKISGQKLRIKRIESTTDSESIRSDDLRKINVIKEWEQDSVDFSWKTVWCKV